MSFFFSLDITANVCAELRQLNFKQLDEEAYEELSPELQRDYDINVQRWRTVHNEHMRLRRQIADLDAKS